MNAYDRQLEQVTQDMFATMAFMFPSEDAPAGAVADVQARLSFTGPMRGRLMIKVPGSLMAVLAGNLLGLDDGQPVAVEQQHDALREVLNVICGNLLPTLAGTEAIFDVQAPEILPSTDIPDRLDGHVLSGRTAMVLEQWPVEVALFLEESCLKKSA